jgi:hypothetical protein
VSLRCHLDHQVPEVIWVQRVPTPSLRVSDPHLCELFKSSHLTAPLQRPATIHCMGSVVVREHEKAAAYASKLHCAP